jgi:hypothetical protein
MWAGSSRMHRGLVVGMTGRLREDAQRLIEDALHELGICLQGVLQKGRLIHATIIRIC